MSLISNALSDLLGTGAIAGSGQNICIPPLSVGFLLRSSVLKVFSVAARLFMSIPIEIPPGLKI